VKSLVQMRAHGRSMTEGTSCIGKERDLFFSHATFSLSLCHDAMFSFALLLRIETISKVARRGRGRRDWEIYESRTFGSDFRCSRWVAGDPNSRSLMGGGAEERSWVDRLWTSTVEKEANFLAV